MFVKPKPGIRVRDPVKKDVLPEEGREVVEFGSYWRRRIKDGDVVVQDEPAAAAAPAAASSAPHGHKKGSD